MSNSSRSSSPSTYYDSMISMEWLNELDSEDETDYGAFVALDTTNVDQQNYRYLYGMDDSDDELDPPFHRYLYFMDHDSDNEMETNHKCFDQKKPTMTRHRSQTVLFCLLTACFVCTNIMVLYTPMKW